MFNIKKKEYNNWLFFFKNFNSSNVQFFTFFHAKYTKNYNWKEFSLLCLNYNLHKISNFYLLNLSREFYYNLKGNSIYYGLINMNKLDIILKNFNFLFILAYNKANNLLLFYLNNDNYNINIYYLNKVILLTLKNIILFNIYILNSIILKFLKTLTFKIKKNDIIN